MASFDSFETIREVYSDISYTVFSAQKSGDRALEYAVKLFPNHTGFAEVAPNSSPSIPSSEAEEIIRCIDIQEKAAAKSEFIAPILARGSDERGVWYVTHFYHRSVNKMINGKVALPIEALYHILRSIAQGALDLKRICGRGHGNIRASNIQISKQRVSSASVVLCDPLPDGAEATQYEARDLKAIGLMLLQLVRLRPVEAQEIPQILPILSSQEWVQVFGKDSEKWVELCNGLLDPNLTLEQFTLEKLVTRLTELQPKSILPKQYIVPAVGAGVFLVLLILIWALWPSGPRPPKEDHSRQVDTHQTDTNSNSRREETNVANSSPTNTNVSKRPDSVLELTVYPGTASIFDSNQVNLGTASATRPIRITNAPGTYVFAAKSDEGLGEKVSPGLILHRRETNRFRFEFDYGTISLSTIPSEATLATEGKPMTKTPATLLLKPGQSVSCRVEKPYYQPRNIVLQVQKGAITNLQVRLDPAPVPVTLVADPPDVNYLDGNGNRLVPSETNASRYWIPWGEATVVARHARLGSLTNHFELKPGEPNEPPKFLFDYGSLMLGNLPKEVQIFEGERLVGTATDRNIYEHTGRHTYTLRWGAGEESIETNIVTGNNYLVSGLFGKGWSTSRDRRWTNSIGMAFAWVLDLPSGGSWPTKDMSGGWVGRFEVTQAQYKKIMGNNPSSYKAGDDRYEQHPVENVTWEEAMEFCKRMTSLDLLALDGWHYTLPTEEQYAFYLGDADRLGTPGRITSEGRSITQFDATRMNQGRRTHPERVGSLKSNQYSLFDVVGNVGEWLLSEGNGRLTERTNAGGSYLNIDFTKQRTPGKTRRATPGKASDVGFRVVLVPDQ